MSRTFMVLVIVSWSMLSPSVISASTDHGLYSDPLNRMCIRGRSYRHTFGLVRTNARGVSVNHQGFDLVANVNDPIFATVNGIVMTGLGQDGFGLNLGVRSSRSGRVYFYAHLASILVNNGAYVKQGQLIGRVGRSGYATSAIPTHLHYEVRLMARPPRGLSGRVSPTELFGSSRVREMMSC